MNEQDENSAMIYEFQPYLVRVIAPRGTEVNFSPFSVSEELYKKIKRGIADINIESDAEIHVYINSGETKVVKLIEGKGWKIIGTEPEDSDVVGWAGYIIATIKAGDPPIAVV